MIEDQQSNPPFLFELIFLADIRWCICFRGPEEAHDNQEKQEMLKAPEA